MGDENVRIVELDFIYVILCGIVVEIGIVCIGFYGKVCGSCYFENE